MEAYYSDNTVNPMYFFKLVHDWEIDPNRTVSRLNFVGPSEHSNCVRVANYLRNNGYEYVIIKPPFIEVRLENRITIIKER